MAISAQLKGQHLLWRAGFGPESKGAGNFTDNAETKLYRKLVEASAGPVHTIDVANDDLKSLLTGANNNGKVKMLSDEERRMVRRKNRDNIKALNLAWLNEMANSEAQLREKLALFWHGHFACRNMNIFYQQLLLDAIRKNALGNFGDLLREVSKSAAMLNFLNNNQNRKGHPNENFAREVMELFTIGRGHYTESDVKEAARAFTGWGSDASGGFVFRKFTHDDGKKKFLNREGNFEGDDILNILLEQKQTARFITAKLYASFVNEKVDAEKVEWLADRFFKNDYHIGALLQDIFDSSWFYDEKNIGTHIKSPIELLVGIRRIIGVDFENEDVQLLIQRVLGQVLFYPPNVAGWPGGKNWIDSSSLMFRLRIPQLIRDGEAINMQPKDDDDQMMGMSDTMKATKKKGGGLASLSGQSTGQVNAHTDWTSFNSHFSAISNDKLAEAISQVIIQTPKKINRAILQPYVETGSRESFIRSITIQLMSTPEYQLC